jgi:hypothetical protein
MYDVMVTGNHRLPHHSAMENIHKNKADEMGPENTIRHHHIQPTSPGRNDTHNTLHKPRDFETVKVAKMKTNAKAISKKSLPNQPSQQQDFLTWLKEEYDAEESKPKMHEPELSLLAKRAIAVAMVK